MSFLAISLVGKKLFWAGLMWYSQFNTYPSFGSVSADLFLPLHKRYEAGLPIGTYLPFALVFLAVIATVLVRPADVPTHWLSLAVVAAIGGAVTTAFGAAPLHIHLIRDGLDQQRVRNLLRWNGARMICSLIGAASAVGLLVQK